MMTTVTVDLADLECLVLTAGALKTVEQAMQQRRTDPFVRTHLDFTDAHNRLAAAMRNAQRSASNGNTVDASLDKKEERSLKWMATTPSGWFETISVVEKAAFDRLVAKGMCVVGQLCEGAVFAGEPGPTVRPIPGGFAARLTDRGRAKVVEIEARECQQKIS